MQRRSLIEEKFQIPPILKETEKHDTTITLLQRYQLLPPSTIDCIPPCQRLVSLCKDTSKADGLIFKCRNGCGKSRSLRYGTIFENLKITLMEAARILLYYYPQRSSITEISKDYNFLENVFRHL